MSYQGGNPGGHDDGHNLQQYPPSTYHMPPPRDYDSDEDQERVPLNASGQPGGGPFQAPFDDPRSTTPGGSQRPNTGYSLSESYAGSSGSEPPGYPPAGGDPNVQFGRAPSPYARSETSSTEAWRQRQAPSGMRRYATRKIKLQQGQVLAIDYPVPSAIQNAVQSKYRQPDVEGGSEEFTHMRCKFGVEFANHDSF